jgi:hypothetical protein
MSHPLTPVTGCFLIKHGTLFVIVGVLIAMQMAVETNFSVDLRHSLSVGHRHTTGTEYNIHFFERQSFGLRHWKIVSFLVHGSAQAAFNSP